MSKRTDIHSEDSFNPDDYRYHGFYEAWGFHFGMSEEYLDYKRELIASILDSHVDGVHGPGQCCHCGAHLRYVLVYLHVPTDSFVCFGETCAIHRLDVPLEEWEAFKADVKRKRGLAIEQGKGAAWREDHPEVVEFFQSDEWDEWLFYSMDFLSDMDATIRSKGRLTDPQLAATERAIEKGRVHEAKARKRDAEREIAKQNAEDVPVGKGIEIEGRVISVKSREGRYGLEIKMTVEDDRGFRVWGTCPESILLINIPTTENDRKARKDGDKWFRQTNAQGAKIKFVANLCRSGDDPKFGFFKRPRKIEIIEFPEIPSTDLHPTVDELGDYVDPEVEVDATAAKEIVGHLEDCASCAKATKMLVDTVTKVIADEMRAALAEDKTADLAPFMDPITVLVAIGKSVEAST